MIQRILLAVLVMMIVPMLALAQGRYSIKSMTPEVKQALEGRKERFSHLRALKSAGVVGENNRGYLEAFKSDPEVQSVVSSENEDRKIVYQTIAQQNGLEGALSTIESAFAEVQKEKAEAGDKVQSSSGSWGSK